MEKADAFHFLGRRLRAVIDRLLGWQDARFNWAYPLNYGYIPGVFSADGEELDAYVLGPRQPLTEFEGVCAAVIERLDDVECKLVLVEPGARWSEAHIRREVDFIEQYFCSRLRMAAGLDGADEDADS